MVKEKIKKGIALLLITMLILVNLNFYFISDSINAKQESKKTINDVMVKKELVNERTKNSNTYLLSDGTKRTEIFSENIRYKENGKWVNCSIVNI